MSMGCDHDLGGSGRQDKTYDVTGISPQSMTVAQLLNGLVSNGTL